MPMIEEMEASGKWLFRWRSYLPLVAIVLLFSGIGHFTYPFDSHYWDQGWELFCLGVSFLGLLVRILTVGYAPPKTSGRNTKKQVAEVLNTTGMYSIVRNPLYLGNFLVAFGPILFFRVWWVSLIFALLFLLYYERIIFAEETFLRKKFGAAYLEWVGTTPMLLPHFRKWHRADRSFNWRKILRQERQTLFGVVVIFYILEAASEWQVEQSLFADTLWNILVASAFILFVMIRMLRKLTPLLNDR